MASILCSMHSHNVLSLCQTIQSSEVYSFISTHTTHLPEVAAPETKLLTLSDVYKTNLPDAELLRQHFIKEGRVDHKVASRIIKDCTAILRSEPNILDVPAPITGWACFRVIYGRYLGR